MKRRFQKIKRKNRKIISNGPSLIFAWLFGFFLTLVVLFASKFIGYEIISQHTSAEVLNNFSSFAHLITRFIKTPEIILSTMGGFLSFGLRYLFLFGKQYSV